MPNELNHFIVHCRNRRESAAFLADLMAAPAPFDYGRFTQVNTSNNVRGRRLGVWEHGPVRRGERGCS